MTQSFELALQEMLSDPSAKSEMLEVAKKEMEERIRQQFKWSLPDTIAKECNDFIKEHVAPEVRAHLLANKGAIVAAAKASADEIGASISQALIAKVEKGMGESWTQSKVLDALFK